MDTRHFYTDANIFALISQFIDTDNTAELKAAFDKAAETLGKTECRIPVLGTQGAGKSSFLNAILFGDILLPVDADETTCIPTEIRYGDNVQPQATVHFQDGRQKEAVCTEKGLAEYVHQDRNPGNSKLVSHIEIRCKSDLLKKGIILVDLPGVGSLTLANQKTTLDYLKKSSAAIFMLRTVPPITKSEAVFVQSALPLINKVFWVQNQWTDESAEEVQDGCDDNEKKIKDIANRVHKPEGYATRPIVVCVKKALDGRIDDNEKMVKQSQIEPFIDRIVDFAAHWQSDIQANLHQEAQTLIASAQATATEQQSNYEKILSGEEDKAKAELERQYEEAEKTKRENKDKIGEVRDFVDGEKATLRHNIAELARKGAEDLRNRVREIIESGLTGGERLANAYNDNAKEVHEEIFQELQPSFLSLVEQTTQIISGLKPVSLGKEALDIHGVFSEKGKGHAHSGTIGGAAGGIGGLIGGAKLGAMAGTAIGGPLGTAVGTLIGALCGLAGGLLGNWIGGKIGERQLDAQKEKARTELFMQIETFRKSLVENYRDILDNYIDGIGKALREWNKEQNDALENKYEERSKDFDASKDEIQAKLDNIKKAIEQLGKLAKEMTQTTEANNAGITRRD